MRAALFLAFLGACGDSTSGGTPARNGTSQDSGPESSAPSSGDPALDDARAYNLQKINAYRKQAGAPPLVLADPLNAFAQAASADLQATHQPHAYFIDHAQTCGCGVASENQGDWNGVPPADVHTQIDEVLALMMSGGPGEGHHDNIVNPKWARLGAGIVNPGGKMYFTNDFGP